MTTMLFLVRHAAHSLLNHVLVGRTAGVRLEEQGRHQARRLAERLKAERIEAVLSSPQERARETADLIAERAAVHVKIEPALDEIDVGEWAGRSFEALESDERWSLWNSKRATARPPNGESMAELQDRVVRLLERLRLAHPAGRFVLVSHAEPIRAGVLHCLRMPLDEFAAIEVGPASITTIALDGHGTSVLAVNESVS